MSSKVEKELTAIMFTDIVGYSEMVNSNQNHAMELLAMHDKIIEPIINNNDGKIIKKIGDAIFAEFPNSFNSVVCAQNIQTELNKRNEISNPKDKIVIRIGLHAGTFIRKDNDLFGHDVNLCSRIESMAPEGGIAASCNLIDSLKNNNIPYREMGFVKLKNISNPHKLYKIYNNFDEYDSESPSQLQSDLKGIGIDIIDMDSYSIIDTVSIAVLYINNLTSESKESISYSLTNELIDDLAYIEKFRVCSFNDISQFIKSGMEKSDIGRQLKVDNILSGNIYIKDGKIKLNFELLNINSGKILWSDSWEDMKVRTKSIRINILNGILTPFKIEIPQHLSNSLSEEMSTSNEAIEAYNMGQKYCLDFLEEYSDLEKGITYLNTAIKYDRDFVEAYYMIGIAYERIGNYEKAESCLAKGLKIATNKNNDRGKSYIHRGFKLLYTRWGKYLQSIDHIEKALKIEIKLNNPLFQSQLRQDYANCLNKIQKPELSIEQNKQAVEIIKTIEDDRMLGISYANLNDSYLVMEHYSESIDYGEKAIAKFKKINATNLVAITSNWTAEAYCRIGMYQKMYDKALEAEELIIGLNDFFREGKIEYFKSYYELSNQNFDTALYHIDISIDKFNLSKNTIQEIQSSIEKLKILIEVCKLNKTTSLVKKIEHLINQIKSSYVNHNFIAIVHYLNAENKQYDNSIDDFLKLLDEEEGYSFPLPYWYLAKSYAKLGNIECASICHKKAKNIVENQCSLISNRDQQKSYKNSYYNKKILSDLNETKNESKVEQINVFKFCPSCGFRNEANFLFCPSCGNDLKN